MLVNSAQCLSQSGTTKDTRFSNQCHLRVTRTCLSLVHKIEQLWMPMKVKINCLLDLEMNQHLKKSGETAAAAEPSGLIDLDSMLGGGEPS